MFEFENLIAFLLLLFIPLYLILKKLGFLSKSFFYLTFSDWEGKSFVWKNPLHRIPAFIAKILFYLALISMIIALANPNIVKQEKMYTSSGAKIFFVLDTSPSMAALDMAGESRLEVAKEIIASVVSQMKGISFGLVAMGSDAVSLVSPTEDHDFFVDQLFDIQIGELGDGSAIGVGISAAMYHLGASQNNHRSIVLLTDGENNGGFIHPLTAVALAVEEEIVIYTIGLGTSGTVPIEYIDNKTGKKYSGYLESRFDDALLRTIANESGGAYFKADSFMLLKDALTQIVKEEEVSQSYYMEEKKQNLYEYFLYFSLIAIVLVWFIKRIYLREVL